MVRTEARSAAIQSGKVQSPCLRGTTARKRAQKKAGEPHEWFVAIHYRQFDAAKDKEVLSINYALV
jgi:hypothetical protein